MFAYFSFSQFRAAINENNPHNEENGQSDDKSYDSFDDQLQNDIKFSEKHEYEGDEKNNMSNTNLESKINPKPHQSLKLSTGSTLNQVKEKL